MCINICIHTYITDLILQENGSHIERTIDSILVMEAGGADEIEFSENLIGEDATSFPTKTGESNGGQFRGRKMQLPDDFLRVIYFYLYMNLQISIFIYV